MLDQPNQPTINLTLTLEQTNTVLESLGSLPFAKVYGLIAQIQDQAQRQLNGGAVRPVEAPADEAVGG